MNPRFQTPVNALLTGAVISLLFVFLVYIARATTVDIWFVTYPAHVNALLSPWSRSALAASICRSS